MKHIMAIACVALFVGAGCGSGEAPPVVPVDQPPVAAPEPVPAPPPPDVSPAPPVTAPAPPPDADGDGVPDATDNCPTAANADQQNTDAATESITTGDACDEDDDGDGASDAEELALGADMVVTDPQDPDTDGDEIQDGKDNCPLAGNPEQTDADEDAFGIPCDCNDATAGVHPAATDEPDITYLDRNCDGIDGDRRTAIFVSPDGDDGAIGSVEAPVATVQRAIVLSNGQHDLYVAAGDYDISDIAWPATLRLFGGFAVDDPADPFGVRDIASHVTRLFSHTWVAMEVASPTELLLIDGVTIEHVDPVQPPGFILPFTTVVRVTGSNIVLRYVTILGDAASRTSVGLGVREGATVTVHQCRIEPRGASSGVTGGVYVGGGTLTMVNTIVHSGSGKFATGLDITGGNVTAVHNTILAGGDATISAVRVDAVEFANAAPILQNNVLVAQSLSAFDKYALICTDTAEKNGAVIANNLLAVIPGGTSDPLFVNCAGQFFYDAAELTLEGATVLGNLGLVGETLAAVLAPPPGYTLTNVGIGAADPAATVQWASDAEGVVRDLTGKERVAPYDLGAMENP